ncbi:MAG: hypothetical protein K2Q22_13740, partial [Cytophagales bacterium]|nr:hypothetical protein [Cytophagales bacterium]
MAHDIDDSAFDEDADMFASFDVYKMLIDEGFSRSEAMKKAGLSETELRDFDERVRKLIDGKYEYVCELKFDGLSISLTYENGLLTR